jgi:amino acid transporter
MEDINRRINQINMENFIWIIYFFLIGLCLYANHFEKKYFYTKDETSKEKYRNLTIFIFIIAVIIYTYFFIDGYKDVKNMKETEETKVKNLNQLSLFASGLVLISGLLFLYIAIVDEELNVELAFN